MDKSNKPKRQVMFNGKLVELQPGQVVMNGQVYYRKRLYFKFDSDLGYKPSPKAFYGETKREAEKKAKEYTVPKVGVDTKVLFVDFLRDEFLPQQEARIHLPPDSGKKKRKITYGVYKNREGRIKRFFLEPTIAKIKNAPIRKVTLGKLSPAIFEAFFKTLEQCEEVKLSAQQSLYEDLHLALTLANRRLPDLIHSYFQGIDKPTVPEAAERELFPVPLLMNVLFDESKAIEYRALVALQLYTLARPSELYALRWSDVDLPNQEITYNKKVEMVDGGFKPVDGSKTGKKGTGSVFCVETLAKILRDLQKRRMSEGMPSEHVLLYQGKPLNHDRFKYVWRAAKKALGLPNGPTFYSLKHLGNSLMDEDGVAPAVRQALTRHRTDKMVQGVYRKEIPGEVQTALTKFDADLRRRYANGTE